MVLRNILPKSVFGRLISGFMLVIILISTAHVFAGHIYIESLENEITKNAGQNMDRVVTGLDDNFTQIRLSLFQDIYGKLPRLLIKENLSAYNCLEIYKQIEMYRYRNEYLKEIFVVNNYLDYVITSNGSIMKSAFFEKISNNPIYNLDFWSSEMKENYSYRFYPSSEFYEYPYGGNAKKELLMPIAIKNAGNSNYIMVLLIDVNKMIRSLDSSFLNFLNIYKDKYTLLFPDSSKFDISERESVFSNYTKIDTGYLYMRKKSENNLIYAVVFPDTIVREQLRKLNTLVLSFIAISIFLSVILSLFLARKFNNPVKRLVSIIEKGSNKGNASEDHDEVKFITENVKNILGDNVKYIKDISEKKSMLNSFLYQAKAKGVYYNVNEILSEFSNDNSYCVLCLEIHYRKVFHETMPGMADKASFLLKELIYLYTRELFDNSVVFQIETNMIVCVVNVDSKTRDLGKNVQMIMDRLSKEDEYACFTAAVSSVYSDISELNDAYFKALEALKYKRIDLSGQILTEESVKLQENRYYFTSEQRERLVNGIKNGAADDVSKQVSEILEYNFKREVSNLYYNLLCTEIINCCAVVLTEYYYRIPDEIGIDGYYIENNDIFFYEEYKMSVLDICMKTTLYVNRNKAENDYITDYVKTYVEDHYHEDVYLDLLAGKLNITSSYLSHYFKMKTGTNLVDFINGYRIRKALELMKEKELKLKDIAQMVGINNTNTFTRIFKSNMGVTPNEYRKTLVN